MVQTCDGSKRLGIWNCVAVWKIAIFRHSCTKYFRNQTHRKATNHLIPISNRKFRNPMFSKVNNSLVYTRFVIQSCLNTGIFTRQPEKTWGIVFIHGWMGVCPSGWREYLVWARSQELYGVWGWYLVGTLVWECSCATWQFDLALTFDLAVVTLPFKPCLGHIWETIMYRKLIYGRKLVRVYSCASS